MPTDRNDPSGFAAETRMFGSSPLRPADWPWKSRAAALALALAVVSPTGWGQTVSTSGDASPVIPTASSVDLTGTRILLGGTSGVVGLTGFLNVLAGGTLTTAGIVPGYGGFGTGTAISAISEALMAG